MACVFFSPPWLFLALTILVSITSLPQSMCNDVDKQIYIVYMGEKPSVETAAENLHLSLLEQVVEDRQAAGSLIYSYKRSLNGFAARLTQKEQQKLADMEGVVSVFPSKTLKLHTTRSWNFLGFPTTVERLPKVEGDVIVGMMDTGIWPELESFSDKGFGPPPKRWKGICQNFTCNKKIIGARFYNSKNVWNPPEGKSPRDIQGHGTHTSSTVAGIEVKNTSLFGIAGGTARGAVPSARIAVYKVCWVGVGCEASDILAAFDDAISDGVDVISISLGGNGAFDYFGDAIAIGSFHAMKKGILTVAAAGNAGPDRGTVSNVAPWLFSVAASTIDRRIINKVVVGGLNKSIVGHAINIFPTEKKFYPLVDGTRGDFKSAQDKDSTKGKIVLVDYPGEVLAQLEAGAHGLIIESDLNKEMSNSFPLPVSVISTAKGDELKLLINKTRNPVATIRKSQTVLQKAPKVAGFSSRGPNLITLDVLKPDITAPGVDILAGWSPKASMSGFVEGNISVNYNIISGTSMACPHVSGAALYVKTFHPTWSPAAIQSALMTTASPLDPSKHRDAEFAYGAGEINPAKAIHPGLVYDAVSQDYVQLLCNQGYDTKKIRLVTGDKSGCPKAAGGTPRDLNYPSMSAFVEVNKPFKAHFLRITTNVGAVNSTYKATIRSQPRLHVSVTPETILFKSLGEKKKFVVTVSGGPMAKDQIASASLIWSDGKHSVRSPIIVHTNMTIFDS